MGAFTNYLEDKIINHIFGMAVFTPVTFYIGLLTSPPGESGDGIGEPAGAGYQRLVTSPADWTTAEDGCVKNISNLCFALACGSWGLVTHFALFDAQQAGRLLISGELNEPVTIGPGAIVSFAPGELVISLD